MLGTPDMIAALEANLEEEMLFFGHALPDGEIYNDGEIEGFFTGHQRLNGVLRTRLRQTDAASVEAHIHQILRYFQNKGVDEIVWSLGEMSRPTDMANYLERQGFQRLEEENIGMGVALAEIEAEEPLAGLEIKEITTLEDLYFLRTIEHKGFGSSPRLAQDYYDMYAHAGFGQGKPWRHFSGWWQGEAVAATSLLFHAGVAGIFGVATLPAARRQGIARAMVLHALHQARQAGYHVAVLSPTNMSAGIYQRLGFRNYTRICHYWKRLQTEH